MIQTSSDELFGGFSSIGWDSISAGVMDPKSFIFNSKFKKFIFNLNTNKDAETNLYFHDTMGP